MAKKVKEKNSKDLFLNTLDEIVLELGKISTNMVAEEVVDLETFLYDYDYLNLTQNGKDDVKLSPIQLDFLKALDDDNPETNQYLEAVIKWGKGCIEGSAIIEDIKGNKYNIQQLENLYKKDKNFKIKINSYNEETKLLEEDIIDDVWIKGETELYEIELENGKKVKVSLDHMFLTDNGWKKLKELSEGDKIISYE